MPIFSWARWKANLTMAWKNKLRAGQQMPESESSSSGDRGGVLVIRRRQAVLLEANLGLPLIPGVARLLSHVLGKRLKVNCEARAANVIRVERVGQRGVGNVVVDAVVDEVALASRTLLDGSGGAGREGPGRDGVDTHSEAAASLPGQGLGIRLELRLGRRHTAAVAGDHTLRGDESERESHAASVHVRAKVLEEGHHRVGRGRRGGEVSRTRGLQERLGHLRAVRK